MTRRPNVTARSSSRLEVMGLQVRYDAQVALRDIGLTVEPGRTLAVTGPSGAGKSSLLWALGGALSPHAGTVTVGGTVVTGRPQAAALGVVMIPQGHALATVLTAEENVLVPLLASGHDPRTARARVTAALGSVGLGESARHLVEELSGGQQQRVAIARALAMAGSVLLADEPTSDLDEENRRRVVATLRAEAEAGAVVVVATHDPETAAELDAEIALDEGRMRRVRG